MISGNLLVSNIATIGNAQITLANVVTLNVHSVGAVATVANVTVMNVTAENTNTNFLIVRTRANASYLGSSVCQGHSTGRWCSVLLFGLG